MKTESAGFHVSWRTLLTGGLGSLLLHVAVLVIVSVSLRGCQKASSGQAGGERFRDVGLFVVEGIDEGAADDGNAPGAADDRVTQPVTDPSPDVSDREHSPVADSANANDRLPSEAPSVNQLFNMTDNDSAADGTSSSTLPQLPGPGDLPGGQLRPAAGGASSLIQPSESGGAARVGGTGGPGQTTFMDIAGVGKTFVYVIDTSSSMNGSRLKVAKGQLKASLRLLQPNQKFAVIFYNEHRERLKLRRQAEQSMYFATELNKQLATQEIDRITPDRGTEHKLALIEALSLKPDVVYFLTDGDEPALSAAELKEIHRHTGRTTIHVIKLGDGKVSTRQISWLELLARQAGGEFREFNAGE
jgi:Ca-activated chloride channel family protein